MALRAMGCSLMGVGKVFLRHIAPTRYGDQTLSAGEHLLSWFPGSHSGALRLLREPLCMSVQSDYTWSLSVFFITVSIC
jgi:hypothetical protein